MEAYLVARAGSTSGLGIRSIRVCATSDELSAALAEHDFPGRAGARAEFPYRLRVYKCTPNAQPKKLNEFTVLRILGIQGRGKFPDSPSRIQRGAAMTYGKLTTLKDKSTVWVEYRNPDTGELVINEGMTLQRSYSKSTKDVPVWKLISLEDKRIWEYFIQDEGLTNRGAEAVDADGMRLFLAQF